MLKTLLAYWISVLLSSPVPPLDAICLGMTKDQVEAVLGEPEHRAAAGVYLGPLGGSMMECASSYEFKGVTVHFRNGRVCRVVYE